MASNAPSAIEYYPFRNTLQLWVDGACLLPRTDPEDVSGLWSYLETEPEDDAVVSNKIVLNVRIPEGALLDAWSVGSSVIRDKALIEQWTATAGAAADAAVEAKDGLEDARDAAVAAAEEAAGYAALLDGAVNYTPPVRARMTVDQDEDSGAVFSVPTYGVGTGRLMVYFYGLLCSPGPDGQYMESGADGTDSAEIIWNDPVPQGAVLEFVSVSGGKHGKTAAFRISV
jgi:hypothetical protein